MDIETIFTSEEKAALKLLVNRGFEVFTEAKLEDVKELDGTRHRTFRNMGRYDLALMLRHATVPLVDVVEEVESPPKVVEVAAIVDTEKVEIEVEAEPQTDAVESEQQESKATKKRGRKKRKF